jgi:methylmalonyl-CoA mutase N-terminal domain/subunit
MRRLFAGIPLDQVSVSMTINAPAIVLLAFFTAAAEEQGVPSTKLRGTTQNDMLKEFIAQKEWICGVRPAMRIIGDMMAHCSKHLPQWNTISISGYHIREAGATAVQEAAFTLADGIGYLQLGLEHGLDVDDFAPRLSYFFDVHNDFFEEIAKLRAARRIWARIVKERFGAKNPRSWILRTHCQTAGVSLTAQQPYNNIIRTTIQALAGVLGGTQSLHTNSFDETYALPTEQAATIALRTQQVIAEESGVANVVDPLAGSYFVESLTSEMERQVLAILQKIDDMGGIVNAIEQGYPQKELAKSAFKFQREVETRDRVVVGVNGYVTEKEPPIPTLKIHPEVERAQAERIRTLKASRDPARAAAALERVRQACQGTDNLFPPILEAAKADLTVGEISDVFREVFGVYRDPAYL